MYVNQLGIGQLVPSLAASVAPGSISATGVRAEYACIGGRVEIVRVAAVLAVAAGAGAATVQVKRRSAPGVSAGEEVVATLTIPASTVAGKVVYKDINQVVLSVGQALAFEVTAASAAGTAVFGFMAHEDAEYKLNESNMIASA